MTITLTYESTLSRVRVDSTTVGVTGVSGATFATFERSLDQVTWTTVRCGLNAPLVSGSATIYDYEFTSGVVNYYRSSIARDVTFVNAGSAAHANNANVTPGLPPGHVAGDTLLLLAAIHNLGVGSPNTPTGYTLLLDMGNVRLFGKVDGGAEAAPTVSFTGGTAGPTSAQMSAFRNVALFPTDANQTSNTGQNIAYPALTPSTSRSLLLYLGWKRNNFTSVNTLAGDGGVAAEIGEFTTFQGAVGQGLAWDWLQQTSKTNVVAGSFVVVGGGSDVCRGAVTSSPANVATQVSSITPVITTVWLKSITKPFLNRTFVCVPPAGDVLRGDRTGIFEVINRGVPVAVTDLKQSREVELQVVTRSTTEWQDLDLIMSTGETMFVHTPLNYELQSMYVVVGQVTRHRPLLSRTCDTDWRIFTLPLREVATPDVSICGSTVTWQSVINFYATWQTTINGETSWLDLLANVGSPTDVIVL